MSDNNESDDERFSSVTDVPVNDELINALKEAGASKLLMDYVQVNPDDVGGVERNSVRLEIQKYCYWEDEISSEAILRNKSLGGSFFQYIWMGNRSAAHKIADYDNDLILNHLKEEEEVNTTLL